MKTYSEKEIQNAEANNRELMRDIRLRGMADRWEEVCQNQAWLELPSVLQLNDLLNHEFDRRSANAVKKLLRQSNLPSDLLDADFQNFRLEDNRKLDMQKFTLISAGSWMWKERPADLVIAGSTGVGKSYLAAVKGPWLIRKEPTLSELPDSLLSSESASSKALLNVKSRNWPEFHC